MAKFLRGAAKFIISLLLLWQGAVLLACTVLMAKYAWGKPGVSTFLGAFALGLVLFHFFRLVPVYIFGHEATHWVTAKLFLRRTGKFRVGRSSGKVEVENANIWIILSPYIVPFYVFVAMGIAGLCQLFKVLPQAQLQLCFAVAGGLAYAYHVMLTKVALSQTQSDLQVNGYFLSMSLILLGNVLFVLLALLFVTGQWEQCWRTFCLLLMKQWRLIAAVMQSGG